ncbi:MAG: DJ-1/PfpI family protein [Candidatus Omnitrophota bacterium]
MRYGAIAMIFIGMVFPVFAYTNTILMVVPNADFRDEELLLPKKIFEEAGYKVEIAAAKQGKAKGVLGAEVTVERTLDQIQVEAYDALVLVGGPGAQVYWDDSRLHHLVQAMFKRNKVIGAICLAPVSLANAGILQDKKATVWHSEAKRLGLGGAQYLSDDVVSDGKVITANGPQAAEQFAKKFLEELKK